MTPPSHPEEQVNFRISIEAVTQRELSYEFDKDVRLSEGTMHFPPGCNSLVEMRVLMGTGSARKQITPINDQFIALDDAVFHFLLDQKLARKERVFVEVANYDEDNPHIVSTIISYIDEKTASDDEGQEQATGRRRRA